MDNVSNGDTHSSINDVDTNINTDANTTTDATTNTTSNGSKKRKPLKILLPIILFLFVLGVVGFGVYEYFRIAPRDVRFTNVSSSSVTVSWNTKSATSATAMVFQGDTWMPVTLFGLGGERFYDTRDIRKAELEAVEGTAENIYDSESLEVSSEDFVVEVEVKDMGSYYTHHVEIKGLDPETEYSFMVGDRFVYRGVEDVDGVEVVRTLEVPKSVGVPVPAYGSVKDAGGREDLIFDELAPVTDATIYFNYFDEGTKKRSDVLSSAVNEDGNWYLDVSQARDERGRNFRENYDSVWETLVVELVIDAGDLGIWKKTVEANVISPTSLTVLNMPGLVQDSKLRDSVVQIDNPSGEVRGVMLAQSGMEQEICEMNGLGTWSSNRCNCVANATLNTNTGVCSCNSNYTQSGTRCVVITQPDPCSCFCPSGWTSTIPGGDYETTQGTCNRNDCTAPTCYRSTAPVCTGCSCLPPCPPSGQPDYTHSSCQSADVDCSLFVWSTCDRKDSCGDDCTWNGESTFSRKCYKAVDSNPVDGACGPSQGSYTTGSTDWRVSGGFCKQGSLSNGPTSFMTESNPTASWSCNGADGGSNANCNATLEVVDSDIPVPEGECDQFASMSCDSKCYSITGHHVGGGPIYEECSSQTCRANAAERWDLDCDVHNPQEDTRCPGDGIPGVSCTYVPGEGCKQCRLYNDAEARWIQVVGLCGNNTTQTSFSCESGGPDICEESNGSYNYATGQCECDANIGLQSDGQGGCKCFAEKEWDSSKEECVEVQVQVPYCDPSRATTFESGVSSWPFGSNYCTPSSATPTVSPDFPAPGETALWRCEIGSNKSGLCTASRLEATEEPPEKPDCGTRARDFYHYQEYLWDLLSYCKGDAEATTSPDFPDPGETALWRCEIGSNKSGMCSAVGLELGEQCVSKSCAELDNVFELDSCTPTSGETNCYATSVTDNCGERKVCYEERSIIVDYENPEGGETIPLKTILPIAAGTQCPEFDSLEYEVELCDCIDGVDRYRYPQEWCRETRLSALWALRPNWRICVDGSEQDQVCSKDGLTCKWGTSPVSDFHPDGVHDLFCNGPTPSTSLVFPERPSTQILSLSSYVKGISAQQGEVKGLQYLLNTETGMFVNLPLGIYAVEYEGETYTARVNQTGEDVEVLLYIDVNGNGEYDEGIDINVAENASLINISPIELIYNYSLKEGFNFVSFPFLIETAYDSNTAVALLLDLNERYGNAIFSISKYDGRWKMVGQNTKLYDNNDFQLLPGQGYVIKAKESVSITLVGQPVRYESTADSAPISLYEGWNLVGLYGTGVKTYTAKTMILDINETNMTADNVSKWDKGRQMYEGFVISEGQEYGFDYPINPLEAVFVRILEGRGNWQPKLRTQ